jgi:hypothetical protein
MGSLVRSRLRRHLHERGIWYVFSYALVLLLTVPAVVGGSESLVASLLPLLVIALAAAAGCGIVLALWMLVLTIHE